MTEKTNDFSENPSHLWVVLFFFIAFLFSVIYCYSPLVNKSALAKSYGVSVRTLMKWVKLFCPKITTEYYVGSKKQKVRLKSITQHLGKAADYPKDGKGRILNNRIAIQKAFNIGQDTLARHINKLEEPEQQIGMTLATYKQLHQFPPKYSLLLVDTVQARYSMKH